jgi:hypothetical protein
MFHAQGCRGAGFSAIAQIVDEARIVRSKAAEPGAGHGVGRKETLDFPDQHEVFLRDDSKKDFSYVDGLILQV